MKRTHPDENEKEVILPSLRIMFTRMWRAFRNDGSIYGELKTTPKASTEAQIVILIIGIISFIGRVIFSEITINTLTINGVIYYFSHYLTAFYLGIILSWVVGVKILRGESTFIQVLVALAYGNTPQIFFALPFPLNALGLWSIFTRYSAIRKTLNLGKWMAILTLIVAISIENYLTPYIFPWVIRIFFFWAIPE